MKKFLLLLTATMLYLSVFVSSAQPVMASSSLGEGTIQIDGVDVHIKTLSRDNNSQKMEIKTGDTVEEVDIDYRTKMFTITDSEGAKKTYNANDFVVNDEQAKKELAFAEKKHRMTYNDDYYPAEQVLSKDLGTDDYAPANYNSSKQYFYDIHAELGMTGTLQAKGSYLRGSQTINVYQLTNWKTTQTLKKYEFTAGTALSVVIAAISAFIPGVNTVTFLSFFRALSIAIMQDHLGSNLSLYVGVEMETIGKGYFVGSRGYATKTKIYNEYLYGNTSTTGSKRELYGTGNFYNYFYNNWSDPSVADVAFQQHRYIEGLRTTAPTYTEFSK